MLRQSSVGFLIFVSLVACTHVTPGPSPAQPVATSVEKARAAVDQTSAAPPSREVPSSPRVAAPGAQTAPTSEATQAEAGRASVAATNPVIVQGAAASSANAAVTDAAKPKPPTVDNATKGRTAGPRSPPPAAQAAIAGAPQKPPSQAALDLASLEQRLRDTRAIGLFAKLSVKNQVDDLLNEFRAFHGGQIPPTLVELRQRYDLLLLKVLTLLQDGDPPLATAVASSREAIWGILANREKFQKI